MESFLQDLKQSLRLFRLNPAFTASAIAALALGIGLNTAIFSLVNTVLLKPSPFPDAENIVLFQTKYPLPQGADEGTSPAKFAHYAQQNSITVDVAAFRTGAINLTGGELPEQLRSSQVSSAYFRLFGAPIILGRAFSNQEDLPNGGEVALISEALWIRRFASDPQITSKSIELGGKPHAVIGVIGSSFDFRDFGASPDVWTPFQLDPNSSDQGHYFRSAGRLRPGIALEQAKVRMNISAGEFRQKFPNFGKDQSFTVESLRVALVSDVRRGLLVLIAAVGMVLLIACANVANLLLARSIARKREIAIRCAIGAGRGRVIRQLLTESMLLAVAGSVLGVILGIVGIRALLSVNTAGLPRVGVDGVLVTLDWRVLAFTAGITILTSLLFGLFPALQASNSELSATLKESSSRSGSGRGQNLSRSLLVISEIALAVVLLTGAALLIRTSLALSSVKPGFDGENILTMRMSLAGQRYLKSAAVDQLVTDGVQRIRAIPGVLTASATCCLPLEGSYGLPFLVIGRPLENGPFHGLGGWKTISPGYFDVFKIPVVRGRALNDRDNAAGAPVVIINEAMAKKFWPKGDPLNDRIWIGKGLMSELAAETPRQIIGVVGDVRDNELHQDPQPSMYVPNAQVPDALNALNIRLTPIAWVVRTRGEPLALSGPVQEQLRQASGLPVSDIRSMTQVISRSTSRHRFNMLLMTVFAGAALLLAAIGVYGLMAYSVQQRTQEIGIRMALGAEKADIRKMVVFQGMRFAFIGVLVGEAAALGLSKLIATMLYGVEARDPFVFLLVPLLLFVTAVIAVWFPARKATQVDPINALRME